MQVNFCPIRLQKSKVYWRSIEIFARWRGWKSHRTVRRRIVRYCLKTSTGFNGAGASVEAVQAMLEEAQGRIRVKASGGIRDYQTAKMYLDMVVARLGVGFSGSKAICQAEPEA